MASIPRRSLLDSDTWFTAFNVWAENSEILVDTLNPDFFKPVIEAVSLNHIEYKLMMLANIYQYADSDEAVIEAFNDEIELLENENERLDDYLGKWIVEFPFISPKLVDEYLLLQAHARNTASSEASFCSIMTWSSHFPAGFQYLLRVRAVHTRRIENLSAKRDLITSGRLHLDQCSSISSIICWDVEDFPHGHGYERLPMPDGLADFDPPSLTKNDPGKALSYVRSAAFIRSERRRSALARLQQDRGGLSDFLAPNYVDVWFHRFSAWVTDILPVLFSTDPAYTAQWIDVANELKAMHCHWTAEAEYQGPRVLTT
ncbi:hypothetical protein QM012_002840 [Aureobasidium pullulans]|uniref:Terpenoid synthase n=1 Tax=Aureobasidium pullulans TaxID=5580 RepID=A0ABR0TB95_AURPU